MSEGRSVVYSLHLRHEKTHEILCYKQLQYSLETLRCLNGNISVKVFLSSPNDMGPIPVPELEAWGAEVIRFYNPDSAPGFKVPFSEGGFHQLLDHRWKNVLYAVKCGIDCALFVDSDTIFRKDPDRLFDTYSDRSVLWAREDTANHITAKLGVIDKGMNDGQFLLSKEVCARLEPNFADDHKRVVNYLLELGSKRLEHGDYVHLNWLVVQYAVMFMLRERGIPFKSFAQQDALLSTEAKYFPPDCGFIHHYFSGMSPVYLPKRFWPPHKEEAYTAFLTSYK